MLSTPDNSLVVALHEGALETPRWATFLERLRARTRADSAGISFRGSDGRFMMNQMTAGHQISDELGRRYLEEFQSIDPVPHDQLRPNRVYSATEFIEPGNPDHERFITEFSIPAKNRYTRMIRVTPPGGMDAWLVIARESSDFGADASALLSNLAPHFAVAVRTHATLQQEKLRAGISAQAIRKLNFGWLTLDSMGIVLQLDEQAETILETADVLRRNAAGKLVPVSRDAQGTLAKLLRQAAAGQPVRPTAIHLADEPWLDMLISPMADIPLAGASRPALIAYVHGEEQATAARQEQLESLFGLTRKEALLALAISRGRSLAESAKDLGLTLETTRLYSKRIYAKTGTRGQADLVRLILASVVSMV